MRRLFLPTARQANALLCVGFLSVGYALYLRYLAIEHAPVALECQLGRDTWLCGTFHVAIVLFNHSVFGAVALGAALINLMRRRGLDFPIILLIRRKRFEDLPVEVLDFIDGYVFLSE